MQRRLSYRLFSWVTLVAFVGMLVVKDYHHCWLHCCDHSRADHVCHHCQSEEDIVCVLDGIPLSDHRAHSHSSFITWNEDDEQCAICHFSIAKTPQAKFSKCDLWVLFLCELPEQDYVYSLRTFIDHYSGRAPPVS